ncbi:MAG TPA: 4a-hydroxytetrahydrobiopterin dehydratase [Nocardioidaceae bacterium]|jgi:4a-hydroxytetrahydrobiopterin dehydratase
MADLLTREQIDDALGSTLTDWTLEGDDTIRRDVTADTFAGGIALVDKVAVVADEMNHHPDIDIRWTTITFRLKTHSAGGLTDNDLQLAAEINRLVRST